MKIFQINSQNWQNHTKKITAKKNNLQSILYNFQVNTRKHLGKVAHNQHYGKQNYLVQEGSEGELLHLLQMPDRDWDQTQPQTCQESCRTPTDLQLHDRDTETRSSKSGLPTQGVKPAWAVGHHPHPDLEGPTGRPDLYGVFDPTNVRVTSVVKAFIVASQTDLVSKGT